MKLTSEQVKQTVNQLGAQVLPDEHPAMPQLNSMFGEHTFFVDEMGLKVLEPTGSPDTERHSGEVVSLADWGDSDWIPCHPDIFGVTPFLRSLQK